MTKYVYDFTEGDKDQKDLLGGKGANLAEMTKLGLPVPPGFTITTEACREYLAQGSEPGELRVQVTMALRQLEDNVGRRLGDRHDPLLVSVRSGAKFSMPGMMETVLNIGLNDASVKGLAEESGDERFAWDSYRRLLQMFGKTVLDMPRRGVRRRAGQGQVGQGRDQRRRPRRRRPEGAGRRRSRTRCASTPARSSRSTRASSWTWRSARSSTPGTPTGRGSTGAASGSRSDLGTAVNICTMVFGNLGRDQRHRRRLHPRPGVRASPARTATTCPTRRARTSSPASATPCRLDDLEALDPASHNAADEGDAPAGDALPGPVRHRVHHRARQAVDAADPGRQAHRGGGVPDRRASWSTST